MGKYDCTLENYINGAYSICREERQFVLYLHNILLKYRNPENRIDERVLRLFRVLKLEGLQIEYVFYEVSFMRDFFMRNRKLALLDESCYETELLKDRALDGRHKIYHEKSFDKRLIEYCTGKETVLPADGTIEEVNYGHNDIEDSLGLDEQIKTKMRRMMNAKPDMAVIYRKDDQHYMLFIEFKLESPELVYEKGITQRDVQGEIADFLCNNFLENIKVSESMMTEGKCKSMLVRLVRKENKRPRGNHILIEDLIALNQSIFE